MSRKLHFGPDPPGGSLQTSPIWSLTASEEALSGDSMELWGGCVSTLDGDIGGDDDDDGDDDDLDDMPLPLTALLPLTEL